MINHNENTRVKLPALVHLTRLGYHYFSLSEVKSDGDTNILIDILRESINRLNDCELNEVEINKIIEELKIDLNSDDLGRNFYQTLIYGYKEYKLIDFMTPSNNQFHCVTEMTCKNGSDEFRPDITLFINGLPLSFIEVKKPNNKDGILSEYNRMNMRGQNKKFRRFINMTQLMIFSNNNPYDDTENIPLEGAFYATTAYEKMFFSHFREENKGFLEKLPPVQAENEMMILEDNHYPTLKSTAEYQINLSALSPTNQILTSMVNPERLLMLLKYGITYVQKTNDRGIVRLEKHIMRYSQLFATKAIENKLNEGVKNGIIWHTQGSGKTALAFYNVKFLKDYYQKKGIVAQFYFIVDRLDLLTQAADEFRSRGLLVEEIGSKTEFMNHISATGASHNTGKDSITVVNIQKFTTDSSAKESDYNVNVQRIYFMDEAHRSYNPTGSFLANLINSDRNAVKIALTGTPLIGTIYDSNGKPVSGKKYDSKSIFGDYIHKYYYNQSIIDGYTLKLIREDIATKYKNSLQSTLSELELLRGSLSKEDLYSHPNYVKSLVEYIVDDFKTSKIALNDDTIGAMIVCDSSKQARAIFDEMKTSPFTSALVLHDHEDKETRENQRNNFKKGTIDFLIVFNMLLTGFDAPRLKKLYLGRIIKEHSLLQALTRVNRPYGKFRHGYVVDFADIRKEFDKTNKAYFDELQAELGEDFAQYDSIFKTPEEITADLKQVSEVLFLYNTTNAEVFSQQITAIDEKSELLELRKALELYKELRNVVSVFDYTELEEKFTLENISALSTQVNDRISMVNKKELLAKGEDMSAILNLALEEIEFQFKKIDEHEMVIADSYQKSHKKAHGEVGKNIDPNDPEYISLLAELQRLLKKKNAEEMTAEEMTESAKELDEISKKARKLNQRNQMLSEKYENDPKFMRTHKRLKEIEFPIQGDVLLHNVLLNLKHQIDNSVESNQNMLQNEPYFQQSVLPMIKREFTRNEIQTTLPDVKFLGGLISSEYIAERI